MAPTPDQKAKIWALIDILTDKSEKQKVARGKSSQVQPTNLIHDRQQQQRQQNQKRAL